jgi:adenylate cyclase
MAELSPALPSDSSAPPLQSLPDGAAPALDPVLLPRVVAVEEWLLGEAARLEHAGGVLSGLATRLDDLGISVDRISTAVEALHSEYAGVGRFWTREEGASVRLFPHGERAEVIYRESPFAYVHRTRQWLLLDLANTPDDLFNVVPDLKAEGYRHYVCVPIFFTNGTQNGITFATRSPDGFGERGLAVLHQIMPALAAAMEIRAINRRLEDVLRIYVGDEPHRAILSGTIRRGEVSRIRSAILFADMRNYAGISSHLTPEGAVELLNAYFDCIVPPVEAEGGEILKYMGDGLLAIFRDVGDDTGGAAYSALTAAIQAIARIEAANGERRFPSPVAVGIALHHGEAAYGNVGSGERLDFTVIGRDVNLASRIASLNKVLGEPVLMSQAFVERLWSNPEPLGAFALEGFDEQEVIYRPAM